MVRDKVDTSYTHIQYMTAPIDKKHSKSKVDTSYTHIQYMTALIKKW